MEKTLPIDEYLMLLIFAIVPPILFFILFQKYIMEGVSLGGIKGEGYPEAEDWTENEGDYF